MGSGALEVTSEVHGQYGEIPFWILTTDTSSLPELFSIFLKTIQPIREAYPNVKFSLAFYHMKGSERQLLEYIESVDLNEERFHQPFGQTLGGAQADLL